MRRFFRSLTDFSLVQQLSLILFTVAFVIVVFFSVYLRGNISRFVDTMVTDRLVNSQQTVISRVEGSSYSIEVMPEEKTYHFVFANDGTLRMAIIPDDFRYTADFLHSSYQLVEQLGEKTSDLNQINLEGVTYFYSVRLISNNLSIVSYINADYGADIEESLLSGVGNTSAVVVSILFIIIMFWTFSIITPLQQIRVYINRVRRGQEDAVLSIERKDEIGDLARELLSLQEELKKQELTKEEMIHNISHDLKTPIATIKSYAESIKDGIYPYDTLEKSVDVIIDNANRLEQKVYSLLFLNRLEYMKGQSVDTDKTCDMKTTIETVLLSLKMIRPEIDISCQLEEAVFTGDEESWRIVVENLLDNALRYAESKIVITVKPGEMTISNDGAAISEERMLKLFKPFEKGTKGKFGLGLSICYRVCQAYGYNIDAENQETMVTFRISEKEKPKKRRINL